MPFDMNVFIQAMVQAYPRWIIIHGLAICPKVIMDSFLINDVQFNIWEPSKIIYFHAESRDSRKHVFIYGDDYIRVAREFKDQMKVHDL